MPDAKSKLCVQEMPSRVWHIVSPQREYEEAAWAPIKCSKDEGIVACWTERRQPTCEECLATL